MQNQVEAVENQFDLTVHADGVYGAARIKVG